MLTRRASNGGLNAQSKVADELPQQVAPATAVPVRGAGYGNYGNYAAPASGFNASSGMLAAFWRRKWAIVFFIALSVGGAYGYLARTVPMFTTSAQVSVQPNGPRIIS